MQSRIEEGHLSQAEDLADAGDFNHFSVAYDALDLPPDLVMQPAPDLLAQGVNNLDESLTTSMGYTTTQDVGKISQGRVDDTGTSQATQDKVQPVAALGLERHPSKSSEKSMRTRTSESARSRSSSPRGHAHPVSTRAIGGAFPTSTPKTKMRDESRKTSGSSGHFSNLSIPAIMPYQVPQEFLQWQASERDFYKRKIAEAVAREKEVRKREVELVMQQVDMVKWQVENEKEERKCEVDLVKQQVNMWMSLAAKYEDEAKELKARNNELLDRLLKA
ncbi:hypothetical protein GY45DRAFT_1340692 [Cubamyces sp. BRFM 1775]|nr:hypothetical protein GY45DRAFT_1340692 [Cubamyces sp. BRFM 1775]